MTTINDIISELKGMEVTDEFFNDIYIAFGDYEFEGNSYIHITETLTNPNISYQAYVDHINSPIICIQIKNNIIYDVWES